MSMGEEPYHAGELGTSPKEVYTRVVAALSLGSNDLWHQLSSLVVEELVDYVQPPTFGVLRIVLPPGHFSAADLCSAHGDEVYLGDESRRCLAVYRDDALQRRIGEGEISALGSAVVDDAVFVADFAAHCVRVYARADGMRLRRLGSRGSGPGAIMCPRGLAACCGRVYVASAQGLSVFTEDGAFSARVAGDDVFWGVAADEQQVFVTSRTGRVGVRVLRADDMSLERLIAEGSVCSTVGVCVSGTVLFVTDMSGCRVVAFDIVTGDFVASLDGFEEDEQPHGVAVRADGALFVTTFSRKEKWRLRAAQLL